MGITAHPVTDTQLKGYVIFTDRVIAIASPALAERLNSSEHFGRDLLNEPLLAYNLEFSLVEHWLGKNRIKFSLLLPSMVGQDLRSQRSLLCKGFGWTVMPEFLCRAYLDEVKLARLKAPVGNTEIRYNLVRLPSALLQPRLAHTRQILLHILGNPA